MEELKLKERYRFKFRHFNGLSHNSRRSVALSVSTLIILTIDDIL
jgi:hypothetical protein